jgi:ArsR family transcriptional regulator
MIAAGGPDGTCVCDLVEPSGRSQPTVSHHLRVLRDAGLVHSEKRGVWGWYVVDHDRIAALRAALG